MNAQAMQICLRFSEHAFAFNFSAFSFVMFSCWFPTGFSATFSTLAFVFALPIFFQRIRAVQLNRFELVGLCLFGWLFLSAFWSSAPILASLGDLSEYRIYFMVPVLIAPLVLDQRTQRWAFVAAMLGALIALITSYGLSFGWWKIDGAHLSLANRIYHGFIMASLLMACLLIARETTGMTRLLAATVALLVVYNVLNIETGRTGYLQVILVCLTFAVLTFARIQAALAIAAALILFGLSYLSFERFHDRVNQTAANIEKMVEGDDYHSSAGLRLELYRGATTIGLEHPVTGLGVGDVTRTLQERFESGEIRILTDNVHSEFMNMLIVGGVPALLLFAGFVTAILHSGFSIRQKSRWLGDSLIGTGVILMTSALFNSTIKDYGEKHALIIMLSILGAKLLECRKSGDHSRVYDS
ncbi:MAG: O-antigen ligase family protein [Pseudomonadota bacterium]|nr:O-antigen ligase family protein [Pseudomonadota bacterium]